MSHHRHHHRSAADLESADHIDDQHPHHDQPHSHTGIPPPDPCVAARTPRHRASMRSVVDAINPVNWKKGGAGKSLKRAREVIESEADLEHETVDAISNGMLFLPGRGLKGFPNFETLEMATPRHEKRRGRIYPGAPHIPFQDEYNVVQQRALSPVRDGNDTNYTFAPIRQPAVEILHETIESTLSPDRMMTVKPHQPHPPPISTDPKDPSKKRTSKRRKSLANLKSYFSHDVGRDQDGNRDRLPTPVDSVISTTEIQDEAESNVDVQGQADTYLSPMKRVFKRYSSANLIQLSTNNTHATPSASSGHKTPRTTPTHVTIHPPPLMTPGTETPRQVAARTSPSTLSRRVSHLELQLATARKELEDAVFETKRQRQLLVVGESSVPPVPILSPGARSMLVAKADSRNGMNSKKRQRYTDDHLDGIDGAHGGTEITLKSRKISSCSYTVSKTGGDDDDNGNNAHRILSGENIPHLAPHPPSIHDEASFNHFNRNSEEVNLVTKAAPTHEPSTKLDRTFENEQKEKLPIIAPLCIPKLRNTRSAASASSSSSLLASKGSEVENANGHGSARGNRGRDGESRLPRATNSLAPPYVGARPRPVSTILEVDEKVTGTNTSNGLGAGHDSGADIGACTVGSGDEGGGSGGEKGAGSAVHKDEMQKQRRAARRQQSFEWPEDVF